MLIDCQLKSHLARWAIIIASQVCQAFFGRPPKTNKLIILSQAKWQPVVFTKLPIEFQVNLHLPLDTLAVALNQQQIEPKDKEQILVLKLSFEACWVTWHPSIACHYLRHPGRLIYNYGLLASKLNGEWYGQSPLRLPSQRVSLDGTDWL